MVIVVSFCFVAALSCLHAVSPSSHWYNISLAWILVRNQMSR